MIIHPCSTSVQLLPVAIACDKTLKTTSNTIHNYVVLEVQDVDILPFLSVSPTVWAANRSSPSLHHRSHYSTNVHTTIISDSV